MMIFLIFLISIIYTQDIVSTKSFQLYVSNNTNEIDFSTVLTNMKGFYRLDIINIEDLEWNSNNTKFKSRINNKYGKNDYCELQFKFNNSFNGNNIFFESCNNKDMILGSIIFDDINSYVSIEKNSFTHLSFSMNVWITGVFNSFDEVTDTFDSDDGILREYFNNGNLYIEYNYVDGKREGEQKRWFENGKIEIIYYFSNGKLHGEQKKWYNNGQIKSITQYKNDKLNGISKEWFLTGKLKSKKVFINGDLEKVFEDN